MHHSILIVLYLIVIKNAASSPIGKFPSDFPIFHENTNLNDHREIHPDFIQISVKRLKNDANTNDEFNINEDGRQIPVISDIERIRKVIEIIEFVGEKVGDLIDKIQLPATDPNEPIYDYRSSSESNNNTTIM